MGKLFKSLGWMGNIPEGDPTKANAHVASYFSTTDKDGVPISPAVSGAVKVYEDGSDTESTSGSWVIQEDVFTDGIHFAWLHGGSAPPDNYTAGHDYTVLYTGLTIDGETVNGIICSFSCVNRK